MSYQVTIWSRTDPGVSFRAILGISLPCPHIRSTAYKSVSPRQLKTKKSESFTSGGRLQTVASSVVAVGEAME